MSCVYVIQAGEDGPVKIGIAVDAERRLLTLQTAHHEPLNLRAVFGCESAAHLEREVHSVLESCRASGEWFNTTVDKATRTIRAVADLYDLPLIEGVEANSGGAKGTLTFRIADETRTALEAIASAQHRTLGNLVDSICREYVAANRTAE